MGRFNSFYWRFLLTTHQENVQHWPLPKPIIHRIHRFKKLLIRRFFVHHKLQISSFGGAGTTMLCSYLGKCNVGTPTIQLVDWSPWKHMDHPPKNQAVAEDFRAIYLVSDPREAVLSVFRRGFQHGHIQRMNGDVSKWNYSWDLEDYLGNGVDLFEYRKHFINWTKARRNYPIMIIKYESLKENKQHLLDFARVPHAIRHQFPQIKPRTTKFEDAPPAIQERLNFMFSDLLRDYNELPDLVILNPTTEKLIFRRH